MHFLDFTPPLKGYHPVCSDELDCVHMFMCAFLIVNKQFDTFWMAPLIGTFKWLHTQSLLYPFSLLIIVYPLSSRQPHTDSWVRHTELTKWLPTWDSPGQCITMQCYCFFVLWLSQHWDPPDMGEYSYKNWRKKGRLSRKKSLNIRKFGSLCPARHR